jgi:hypothetical protein
VASCWVETPPWLLRQRAALMVGVKLSIRQREDHVMAALRGELDATGCVSIASAVTVLTACGQIVIAAR